MANEPPVTQKWMVLQRIDNKKDCIRELAAELHLTPCVGIALPVSPLTKYASDLGRIFCFLPLPPTEDDSSRTGLPVHVHGSFSVADDRRCLTWPAKDREEDHKAKWNYLLLEHLLPDAYANIICTLTGKGMSVENLYNAWPVPQNVRNHWQQKMLPAFFMMLSRRKVLYTSACGGEWVQPDKSFLCSKSTCDSPELVAREEMISRGYPIAVVPRNVELCLLAMHTHELHIKRLNPAEVRKALKTSSDNGQSKTLHKDQLQLLRYVLLDNKYNELHGVKLLPVANSSMKTFMANRLDIEPVYIPTSDCPLSLFPSSEGNFVDLSIDEDILVKVTSLEMTRATQVARLSDAIVTDLIKRILRSFQPQQQSLAISWSPSCSQLTVEWMSEVWKWLCGHPQSLSKLVGFHVIPYDYNDHLLQLIQGKPVIFSSETSGNGFKLEDAVADGLEHLGCVVLRNEPEYIKDNSRILQQYVLPPSAVLCCLTRLPDYALISLPNEARQPLLDLLSRVVCVHKPRGDKEEAVLSRLPLFRVRNNLTAMVSITQCSNIAPSPTDLPNSLPVRKKLIQHPGQKEKNLLQWIPKGKLNWLSVDDVMLKLVLPDIGQYSPTEVLELSKYILKRCQLSCSNPKLYDRLKTVNFIPVSVDTMKSPLKVFDSADKFATQLFSGKALFSTDCELEPLMRGPKSPVSFRKITSVTSSELLMVAKEAAKGDVKKSKALISLLANEAWMREKLEEKVPSSKPLVRLSVALSEIPWLPCLSCPPVDYPKSITWEVQPLRKPAETLYVEAESRDYVCYLIGDQKGIVDFSGFLSDELVGLLGMGTLNWDVLLRHFDKAAQFWKRGVVPQEDIMQFDQMMKTVLTFWGSQYTKSQENFPFRQLQLWNTSNPKDWIWINSKVGFVKMSQLVLQTSDLVLEDWRYSVDKYSHLNSCIRLFRDLGMKSRWTESDLISLLKDVEKFYSGDPNHLPTQDMERDLQLSLRVLNWLTNGKDQLPDSVRKQIFVPVENPKGLLELALSSTVTYCNAEMLHTKDTSKLAEIKLVHHSVPHSTAYVLGIPSLMHRLVPSEDLEFEVEAFGQNEPLTMRLKNILKEYKDNASIFKELIQNADDAGATEVKFLVDWRTHPCSSLLSPGMAACQGPALLAYNNASFKDEDFVNICKLAAGTKRKRLEKIGKFGVGFSSVYHLTEVPSFVSDKYIAIFDPHGTHLGRYIRNPAKPGVKIDFTNSQDCSHSRDQFIPYMGIFNCSIGSPHPKPYRGTLFRFPFRTENQAKASEIKNEPCDKKTVKRLISGLNAVASRILIFLNNVKTVEVYEMPANSLSTDKMKIMTVVQSKQLKLGIPQCFSHRGLLEQCQSMVQSSGSDSSMKTSSTVIAITKQQEGQGVSQNEHYLVCSSIGTGRAMTIARSSLGKEAGCMPHASVAIQLQPSQEGFVPTKTRGEVFCVLPLSEATGLPFHVSGFFAVLTNRRGIWWYDQEETRYGSETTNLDARWNDALLSDAVTTAIMAGFENLQQMNRKGSRLENYYELWPDSKNISQPMWATLVSALYAKILRSDRCLICTAGTPVSWLPVSQCLFLSSAAKALPHACVLAKHLCSNFVDIPTHLLCALQSSDAEQVQSLIWDEPKFVEKLFEDQKATILVSSQRNDLVVELLQRVAITATTRKLFCVLKSSSFVPSSPDGDILCKPQNLVNPGDLCGKLFLPEEGRFPWSGLSKGNEETILCAVKKLGMKTADMLTWDDCIARAETVDNLLKENPEAGMNRAKALFKILAKLEDAGVRIAYSALSRLKQIAFLPLMPRPANYPLDRWYANTCSAVVGNAETTFLPQLWYTVGSQSLILSPDLTLPKSVQVQCVPKLKTVLQHLDLVLQALCQPENITNETLVSMVISVYESLSREQKRNGKSVQTILKHLGNRPWLYVQGHLVRPEQLAFRCPIRAPPYLFEVPENLESFKTLLTAVGVHHEFVCEKYFDALQKMSRDSRGERLNEEMIHCAQEILNEFSRLDMSTLCELSKKHDVPVLSKDCFLLPATELAYNDAQWMNFVPSDDSVMYVHDCVSRAVAVGLGVKPVRHKILDSYSSDIPGRPFGQTEQLTQRISDILQEYPGAEEILKELLQNADDAGATEIHIIYDKRQHGVEFVFNDEWKDLQGPAICVYNNKVFTEKDIEGIQNLGRGSKRDVPSAIGQYGIGFNAVYHLTDCPTFVSNNEILCVFDPHHRYVPGATREKPGRLLEVGKTWEDFPDIAHCYQTLPQVILENGTLFRFPLRTADMAKTSEISQKYVSDNEVLQLFQLFEQGAADMLLFLSHVCSIKLSIVGPDGTIRDQFEVAATVDSAARQQRSELASAVASIMSLESEDIEFVETSYTMTLTASSCRKDPVKPSGAPSGQRNSSKPLGRWLVYQCVGTPYEDSSLFVNDRQLCLLPRAGVAAPIDTILDCNKSRVFCFLPLPEFVKSNLPVHVNGHFALNSNRRSLWQDASKRVKDQRPSQKQGWNEDMIRYVLAPAYCRFLLEARKFVPSRSEGGSLNPATEKIDKRLQWFNHLFPDNSREDYWGKLSLYVYEFILRRELAVLPYIGRLLPSDRPTLPMLPTKEKVHLTPAQIRLQKFDQSVCYDEKMCLHWLAIGPPNPLGLQPSYFFLSVTGCNDEQKVNCYVLQSLLLLIGIPIVASPIRVLCRMKATSEPARAQTVCPHLVLQFLRHYSNLVAGCKVCTGPVTSTVLRNADSVRVLLEYVMSDCDRCDEPSEDTSIIDLLLHVPLLLTGDEQLREFSLEEPVYVSKFSSLLPNNGQKHFVHQAIANLFWRYIYIHEAKAVRPLSPDQLGPLLLSSGIYDFEWKDVYVSWKEPANGLPTKDWIRTFWSYLESEGAQQNALNHFEHWPIIPAGSGTLLVPVSLVHSLFFFGSPAYTPDHCLDLVKDLRELGAIEIDANLMKARKPWQSKTVVEQELHPLVEDRVAVLSNHVSTVRALDYLYSNFCPRTPPHVAERILKYVEAALSAIQRAKQSDVVKRLPLFERVDDRLVAIESVEYCYVLPPKIETAGSEVWIQQSDHVFLKYKRHLNSLYDGFGLNNKTCEEVYIDCILPSFAKLKLEDQLKQLIFIQEHQCQRSWDRVIAALKATRCFKLFDRPEPISSFYDPTVSLFQQMLPHDCFPPSSPREISDETWYTFLRNLGLKTVCPMALFEIFANGLQKEADSWVDLDLDALALWTVKSEALIEHLRANVDIYKPSFSRLREIRFIACRKISNHLTRLAAPFYERTGISCHATSFKNSVDPSLENELLCWSSRGLLPDYAVIPNVHEELGLAVEPDLQSVVNHFVFLIGEVKLDRKTSEDVDTLKKVVALVFKHLGKCLSSQTLQSPSTAICDALVHLPCIFLPSRLTFVRPCQVVMSLTSEIPPYLHNLPSYLKEPVYSHILVHLGVAERASPSLYAQVLKTIKERYPDQSDVRENDQLAIKLAVRCLFQCLKQSADATFELDSSKTEIEEEELLYLPDRDMQLRSSSSLMYLNKPEFEGHIKLFDFRFLLNLRECDLPSLKEETIDLLPKSLRPVLFTDVIEERLDPACIINEQDTSLLEVEARLKRMFTSPYFAEAIHSIYTKEFRSVELPPHVEQCLEMLQNNLEVKCLHEIRTRLHIVDSDSLIQSYAGRKNACFLEKSENRAKLYVNKDSFSVEGVQLQQRIISLKLIAVEVGNLLQIKLPPSDLMPILATDDLDSIPQTLSDLGIEYIKRNGEQLNPVDIPLNDSASSGVSALNESDSSEVSPGMPVRADHLELMRMAPEGYRFSPDDWVAYKNKQEHFVYARVLYMYRDSSNEEESVQDLSELRTRYVVSASVQKEDSVIASVMDLYPFEDVEGGQEPSDSHKDEGAVSRQLEEIWKLPSDERGKGLSRLCCEWHPLNTRNPDGGEVHDFLTKEIRRLTCEEGSSDTVDSFLADVDSTARSIYRTFKFSARALTMPDKDKGRKFVAQAAADLKVAEALYVDARCDSQLYAAVCFHCHEAVEKSLKGILFYTEGIDEWRKKQHDLPLFLHAADCNEIMLKHAQMVKNDDYLKTRYPDCYDPCCVPADSYSCERAEKSLTGARVVVKEAASMIDQ
jgi:sacsin